MTGRNELCPCGSGKKYKKCCIDKKGHPIGVLQHVLDYGSSDPFIARMMFQMFEIRDFVFEKDEINTFDKLYDPVLQNLTEAMLVKDKCIDLINKHIESVENEKVAKFDGKTIHVDESIEYDLNIWFKDFFIRGNIASKNLIRLAKFFDYKIAFMFSNDRKFLEGKDKFIDENKDKKGNFIVDMIEDHRKKWYSSFVDFRDKIEHEGFKVPKIGYRYSGGKISPVIPTIGKKTIEEYLNLIWQNLIVLCEDIIILLLSSRVPASCSIMHIPEDKRDPEKPIRYKVVPFKPDDARQVEYKELFKNTSSNSD